MDMHMYDAISAVLIVFTLVSIALAFIIHNIFVGSVEESYDKYYHEGVFTKRDITQESWKRLSKKERKQIVDNFYEGKLKEVREKYLEGKE